MNEVIINDENSYYITLHKINVYVTFTFTFVLFIEAIHTFQSSITVGYKEQFQQDQLYGEELKSQRKTVGDNIVFTI